MAMANANPPTTDKTGERQARTKEIKRKRVTTDPAKILGALELQLHQTNDTIAVDNNALVVLLFRAIQRFLASDGSYGFPPA